MLRKTVPVCYLLELMRRLIDRSLERMRHRESSLTRRARWPVSAQAPRRSAPSAQLDGFLAAAPLARRVSVRVLVALARRPRGALVLSRTGALGQAGHAVLSLARYDEPRLAARLGWDARSVVERGRALRLREDRP
jgi:hypothetical protein